MLRNCFVRSDLIGYLIHSKNFSSSTFLTGLITKMGHQSQLPAPVKVYILKFPLQPILNLFSLALTRNFSVGLLPPQDSLLFGQCHLMTTRTEGLGSSPLSGSHPLTSHRGMDRTQILPQHGANGRSSSCLKPFSCLLINGFLYFVQPPSLSLQRFILKCPSDYSSVPFPS